ncbi:MAG: tyrosine-type recombinase/integrase [Chloroflexota bacterium]|nr:tyrosine-type recombinase/integrase [Chloroflexota bacterium]
MTRLVRQAEKDSLMADAILTLLNPGPRVDELVTLTWHRVNLRARSGRIDIVGEGGQRRRLPLNAEARKALDAILPTRLDDAGRAVFCGKRGP